MSIHKRKHRSGSAWRVQWRDETGRQRSRTFTLKADAQAWDAKVKLAKRQGDLVALDAGRQALDEFVDEWWRLYAEVHLAPATLAGYRYLRDKHLLPRLGGIQLRAITPELLHRTQTDMLAQGVGTETTRRTFAMLQGILERAAEWGKIQRNPVRHLRKPRQVKPRIPRALAPREVEALRRHFLGKGAVRDAALITVLAYAGLRPGEALALRWGDVRENSIVVDKAISFGSEKTTKTGAVRSVDLLAPLRADLVAWRLASGSPADTELVFPTREGLPWSDYDYRNWRRRHYQAATRAAGIESSRVYDLRHSLASLLFARRLSPAEVAEQMGHSIAVLLSTYVHVIADLKGREVVDAEAEIRAARAELSARAVASMLPSFQVGRPESDSEDEKTPHKRGFPEEPTRGFEPRTPSLRVKCSTS